MIALMILLGSVGFLFDGAFGAAVGVCIAALPAVIAWLGEI